MPCCNAGVRRQGVTFLSGRNRDFSIGHRHRNNSRQVVLPHLQRIRTSGRSPLPASISAARSASFAWWQDLHHTCTRKPAAAVERGVGRSSLITSHAYRASRRSSRSESRQQQFRRFQCIARQCGIDARRRHTHGCLIGREQQVLHQELAFRCCRWMEPSDNRDKVPTELRAKAARFREHARIDLNSSRLVVALFQRETRRSAYIGAPFAGASVQIRAGHSIGITREVVDFIYNVHS